MLCLSGFELYSRWVPLYFHSETKIEPDLRLISCCIFVHPLSHDAKRKYGLLEIEEHENEYCDIASS